MVVETMKGSCCPIYSLADRQTGRASKKVHWKYSHWWMLANLEILTTSLNCFTYTLSLIFMFTMSTPKTMVGYFKSVNFYKLWAYMYKIFMECNVVTNLLSSQNLVHYIRCLLYIDVTNFSPCLCWWNNWLPKFICYIWRFVLYGFVILLFHIVTPLNVTRIFWCRRHKIKFWLTIWNLIYLLYFILCFYI